MQDNWKFKGGEGRWKKYINTLTGESTIKEHKLKTVWTSCPRGECYFELTNPGTRECTCRKCGAIQTFVVGISRLIDGKIINLR